jgi:hypothetical protein
MKVIDLETMLSPTGEIIPLERPTIAETKWLCKSRPSSNFASAPMVHGGKDNQVRLCFQVLQTQLIKVQIKAERTGFFTIVFSSITKWFSSKIPTTQPFLLVVELRQVPSVGILTAL